LNRAPRVGVTRGSAQVSLFAEWLPFIGAADTLARKSRCAKVCARKLCCCLLVSLPCIRMHRMVFL
jgi:hypothetical protein